MMESTEMMRQQILEVEDRHVGVSGKKGVEGEE